MTLIVGIEHEHGVIIGGDSAGLAGWSKTIRADQKVFTAGPYVMGFTTSFRMGQLLRYHLEVTVGPPTDLDHLDRYVATTFIDSVRTTLKNGGFAKVKENQEEGGSFLLGVAGRLYQIGSDYQFGRATNGYLAVGCADDIALGSLHTTAQYDFTPEQRVKHALEAGAALSGGVAGPFSIISQRVDSVIVQIAGRGDAQ